MAETPERMIENAVRNVAARATLPFQAARADRSFGTAFWYNDLVESAGDREVVRQYLVTADRRTRYEIGQFTLRDGLAEPELPADELVMPAFVKKWTRLGTSGVAVMPTTDLHIHAERGNWRWTTDEITSGLAAQPDDIALLGPAPLPAYLLGHEVVQEPGSKAVDRPQLLVQGAVTRDTPDDPARWTGRVPLGFEGAPVFAALPMPDGEQVKLVCLGLVLPTAPAELANPADPAPTDGAADSPEAAAPEGGTVITFDRLRGAIHAVTPSRKRHWWQRG
ncbi:hypothetical protein OG552_23580 [Streptomyces sp. NBC_01476]|uniref:hypothetical protein n=1 Tax=Streptomyces sp. NBC_01476 TaxID=2903881 RepID=UPI002E3000D7|nr:hypothetical protein [Streptomyces sp. NBC_01476]